jgi:hypothetical protein
MPPLPQEREAAVVLCHAGKPPTGSPQQAGHQVNSPLSLTLHELVWVRGWSFRHHGVRPRWPESRRAFRTQWRQPDPNRGRFCGPTSTGHLLYSPRGMLTEALITFLAGAGRCPSERKAHQRLSQRCRRGGTSRLLRRTCHTPIAVHSADHLRAGQRDCTPLTSS